VKAGCIAVTGGTGFVGATLIRLAVAQGFQIRALTRKSQPPTNGVIWVRGALDQPESLAQLLEGSDAVIHVAGVTNSPTREGFVAGNINGTRAIIEAAQETGIKRFIHVSSLSAREPGLSTYGWSKAEAEHVVEKSGLDWTMVRPPAIFGPGDTDHLDMFKAARFKLLPLPPQGRMSVLEVSDLGRLLLALVFAPESVGKCLDADDGVEGGWSHADYARAIGQAVGVAIIPVHMPGFAVRLGARIDRLLRGDKAKLTLDRAAYFCHPDWVIDPAKRPPAALWTPQVDTRSGLAATAKAYRDCGWL
jgi:uncharacterized protein YbjT (DUF2867 family)